MSNDDVSAAILEGRPLTRTQGGIFAGASLAGDSYHDSRELDCNNATNFERTLM
jgi:hypothetical protein